MSLFLVGVQASGGLRTHRDSEIISGVTLIRVLEGCEWLTVMCEQFPPLFNVWMCRYLQVDVTKRRGRVDERSTGRAVAVLCVICEE
jgi:hypothetical protein